MITSCSASETTSTTSVEVAKNQISEENPYSLADIPDAQTTLAKNETEIFTDIYGYVDDGRIRCITTDHADIAVPHPPGWLRDVVFNYSDYRIPRTSYRLAWALLKKV